MSSDGPRAFTAAEVRDQIIAKAWEAARFWADLEDEGGPLARPLLERTSGALFTFLALLDGEDPELPGFNLVPTPHPDDEGYRRAEGRNWYSEETAVDDGRLHVLFYGQQRHAAVRS